MKPKPKTKHRTVGPRKGNGSIIIRNICSSGRRRKLRLNLNRDTYEYFMKHGELPKEVTGFKGFTVKDFLKKHNG